MKLDNNQKRILELTTQLENKALEYHNLCDEFEKLKQDEENLTKKILLDLKEKFAQNLKDITELVNEIETLNKK